MPKHDNRPPPPPEQVASPAAEVLDAAPTPQFPIVGIGASAGGLEAFTRLLKALPVDTGMAFVIVQHLSPTHESALPQILSRATGMPVSDASNDSRIERDHVYVIPPDRNMELKGEQLTLSQRAPRGVQHPIDLFLRSLANNQRERAIGVVLSGTGSDGTIGLEEIKAMGGITFVQDETSQFDEMPRNAVASGCVDFQLPPEGIASELVRIAAHPFVAGTPTMQQGEFLDPRASPDKASLLPILSILQTVSGTDFTSYKVNTLARRITRRMILLKLDGIDAYAAFLRENRPEVEALYRDILINVTSFFRDPELFELLKTKVVPALIRDRSEHEPLRVWVLGCSTGEEAFSVAMSCTEAMETTPGIIPAQIFATDINAASIEHARAGTYTRERLGDVSPERQRKFFVDNNGGYRVAKSIRDMCVFAQHNVMTDPPFSRMDLISCRNLLIYMEAGLQKQIIPLLHYALRPGGYLVLGSSETVGDARDLFDSTEAKARIYARKSGPGKRLAAFPLKRDESRETRAPAGDRMPGRRPGVGSGSLRSTPIAPVQGEIDRLLLARFAPAGVVVNAELEILQFRGKTDPFLVPAQGQATFSLLKMARQDLLAPLLALTRRAKLELGAVRHEGLRVRSGDGLRVIDLEIVPIPGHAPGEAAFIVLFEEIGRQGRNGPAIAADSAPTLEPEAGRSPSELVIVGLERELATTRESLQALLEQQETVNEELQSVNEEAQSANEELQSINEELETSKEEIQSSNEELSTVNDELNSRNVETSQLNSDLTNLINSVQIAVVIVGRDLRIRRFSPLAESLLNIMPSDVGRPVTNVRMNLDLPDLHTLLLEAIEAADVREREVQDHAGHWYILRVRPTTVAGGKVDGAVLLLIEIDRLKKAEQAIAFARDQIAETFATVRESLLVLDAELRVESANPSFYRNFSLKPEGTIGISLFDLGNRQWDIPRLRSLMEQLLPGHASLEDFQVEHVFADLGPRCMLLNARRIENHAGQTERILLAIEDITERENHRQELQRRIEELATIDSEKGRFLAVLSHELRSPLNAIRGWLHILQHADTSEEDRRRGLDVIDRNSLLQGQLINDLLDAHRIGSGKVALELRVFDLCDTMNAAISAAEPAAKVKGIHLLKDSDDCPTPVCADPGRLQQVLGNLLSNALKFTPEGGEITVALKRLGSTAEVSVTDTGEGISAEALPRIFEPFRQAESDMNRSHGGLGLGLSIARQLMQLHGGSIVVKSEGKGAGATFTITLPLRTSDTQPVAPLLPRGATHPSRTLLSGIMVLLVDDEPDAREPVRRALEEAGAEVVAVASADEAVSAVRQQRPDVLVSDIGMPVEDGYELMRRIRALPPERGGLLPAIALTSYGAVEDRDRAFSVGYQSHVVKPAETGLLVAAVAALVPKPPRS